jgi:type II secretory pathway pseudopilin PulG
MIEIFVIAIIGIAILILASPNMKGRGYRNRRDKDADETQRTVDEEYYRAKGEARYHY